VSAPLTAVDIPFASSAFPAEWRLLDDVQLLELPDPEFLIEHIVPRHGVGVIYGPSGACKTTLLAGLTTALATGKSWFGHGINHMGPSVYVATEDAPGWKIRTAAAKRAAGLPLTTAIGVYTFPEPIDLRDATSVTKFSRFLRDAGGQLELVIVDTYAAATPGAAENSSEDTTMAMTHAQRWRDDLGVTVILVHHSNASGSRERGHTAMRGAADFMISVTPVDDVIHVECSKQRNASPFSPMVLKLVPLPEGGCVLRLASDVLPVEGLTTLQSKALDVLRDIATADGLTKGEWQRACQDVPERSFHRAAKMLEQRGYVSHVGSHFRVSAKGQR
jgi:hypothetical protein